MYINYHQTQGVMAIYQLQFLDFVVYTVGDIRAERIYFDKARMGKVFIT